MTKWSLTKLEEHGRVQLSPTFFMREMLHSEIAQVNGMLNAPSDPALAIFAGENLCQRVLEPIQNSWGRVVVRSAYRSEEVNAWGNLHKANCSSNDKNFAAHIWDKRDKEGYAGATACIVIPAYLDYFERTGDWASLAWWIHHHIPDYGEMTFFKHQCAFNIRWRENASKAKSIRTFIEDPRTGRKQPILREGVVQVPYNNMSAEERYRPCLNMLRTSNS